MNLEVGDPIPLTYQEPIGSSSFYVKAFLYRPDGSLDPSSPVILQHIASGQYKSLPDITMPSVDYLIAQYRVYTDSLFTVLSEYHAIIEEKFGVIVDFSESVGSFNSEIYGTVFSSDNLLYEMSSASIIGTTEETELAGILSNDELIGILEEKELVTSLGG